MPAKKAKKKKKVVKEDAKAKKQAVAKAKAEAKQRKKNNPDKVKVDPTFGLKNKKGSKNRRFVQNSMNNMNAAEIAAKKERDRRKKEKAFEERMRREEAALFQTVDNDPQFKKKQKKKQTEEKEAEKIEVDDETLLNNCSPDELDGLIDRLRIKFKDMPNLTPVNAETFAIWKEKKEKEKEAEKEAKAKKKLQKKGKKGLTGRELFSLTPNIFKDDDGAVTEIIFEKEENEKKKNNEQQQQQKAEDAKLNLDEVDESLFLDMDDMGDMLDGIDEENEPKIVSKEYVFKSMNEKQHKIICLDADFNDIEFDLDASNKKLTKQIENVIEDGNKNKKDVMVTVSTLNSKQTVSGAHIA